MTNDAHVDPFCPRCDRYYTRCQCTDEEIIEHEWAQATASQGPRKGPGRPRKGKTIQIRIPEALLERVKAKGNPTDVICKLLEEHL